MKEFKINDFLTVKLEENTTNIYVNGVLFIMSKYLMLNIPIEDNTNLDEIESVDEAADILGWSVDGQEGVDYDFDFGKQKGVEYDIDPETEFWGHCSNLQAWYENDYDTRLLHSNLSFPLLKVLTEVGDPIAMRVFKEEIANRIESGYPTVIECIVKPNLSDYLKGEELKQLLEQNFLVILTAIEKLSYDAKLDVLYSLISLSKGAELLEKKFSVLLESIDKLPDEGRHHVFSRLIDLIKDTQVLNGNFPVFLESVDKLSDQQKHFLFFDLIDSIKGTDVLKKHFPAFLESIDLLSNEVKYEVIPYLIGSIKYIELLDKYSSQIETQILVLLKSNDKNSDRFSYTLFNVSIKTGLGEELFPAFLETIGKLLVEDKYFAFYNLLEVAKKTGWIKDHFPIFLEIIDKLFDMHKVSWFFALFEIAEETGWKEEYFPAFFETISKLPDEDKYGAFYALLKIAREERMIEEYFPAFLETISKLPDEDKYDSFSRLFYSIKNPFIKSKSDYLFSRLYSRIEAQFLALLNNIDKLPDNSIIKCDTFSRLINSINGTMLLNKCYSQIEDQFLALLKISGSIGLSSFSRLIDSIKNTELLSKNYSLIEEQFLAFLEVTNKFYQYRILISVAKKMGWAEEHFTIFLEISDKILDNDRHYVFYDLINSIKGTELLNNYYSQIKTMFLSLVKDFDKLPDQHKNNTYSYMIKAIEGTKLENEIIYKKWKEKSDYREKEVEYQASSSELRQQILKEIKTLNIKLAKTKSESDKKSIRNKIKQLREAIRRIKNDFIKK